MSALQPFNPSYTQGQTVTAAAAAASITINAVAKQVVITNRGANEAYIRIGTGAISATVADMIILPGNQISLTKGDGQETVSYISVLGTSLHIIPGEGW